MSMVPLNRPARMPDRRTGSIAGNRLPADWVEELNALVLDERAMDVIVADDTDREIVA